MKWARRGRSPRRRVIIMLGRRLGHGRRCEEGGNPMAVWRQAVDCRVIWPERSVRQSLETMMLARMLFICSSTLALILSPASRSFPTDISHPVRVPYCRLRTERRRRGSFPCPSPHAQDATRRGSCVQGRFASPPTILERAALCGLPLSVGMKGVRLSGAPRRFARASGVAPLG
jgi:hypothetical protein